MSAMTTHAVPLRSPSTTPKPEPKRSSPLRLVPQRRSNAAKTPFLVVVVTILVGGLLGLLLLNTLVAQDSFALHDLASQARELEQREQDLGKQVQAHQAPAALAARAAALGMFPGGPPAFLQLPSGKVLGQAMPGVAPVAPAAPASSTTWTAPRPTAPPARAAQNQPAQPAQGKPAQNQPAKPASGAHR